ncbi:phosphatidylinositol N-acetylglucosaminyltransferase subunit P [Pelomyxa schiedti]|nr:phosphatidylinositol N-acetylglucosaminyltransferase subunit P [Pelomyxa schiedti]
MDGSITVGKAKTAGGVYIETYGFVAWITTSVALVCYLVLAYVPDAAWRALHLESIAKQLLPDKYWALAVPSWLCVSFFFILIYYHGIVLSHVEPMHSWRTYTDEHRNESHSPNSASTLAVVDPSNVDDPVPALEDVPLTEACRILYHNKN